MARRELIAAVALVATVVTGCTSDDDSSPTTRSTPAPSVESTVTTVTPLTTSTAQPPTTPSTTTSTITPTSAPPALVVTDPAFGATVVTKTYTFRGTADPGCTVTAANRFEAAVDEAGNWSITLTLNAGGNVATFVAADRGGATTQLRHTIVYAPLPGSELGTWERWARTNRVELRGIAVDAAGDVWAITSGGLVRWHPADGGYTTISNDSWPEPTPRSIAFTPDGDLWLGFYVDVLRYDGIQWTSYAFEPQGESWSPIELAVGPDGRLWLGASQLGLHTFDDGGWRLDEEQLPGRGDLDTMRVDADGRVWVGMFWSGLWVREGGVWSQEHSSPVPVVSTAPNGDVWYTVRNMSNHTDAVVQIGASTGERTVYPLGATAVWEIVPAGDVAYIGTNPRPPDAPDGERHGLWRLVDGEIEAVPGPWDDGSQIVGLSLDREGTVWLGGQGGVWRYDGASSRHYVTDTYAGSSNDFLLLDEDGRPYVGDCRSTSVRSGGIWRTLSPAPEDWHGCDAVLDDGGTLWLSGRKGIGRLLGDRWAIDQTDASGTPWSDLYPDCGEGCDPTYYWSLAAAGGEVWAAMFHVEDGLWRYRDGGWQRAWNVFPTGSGGVVDMAAGDAGALWVATRHGVHEFLDGDWTHHMSDVNGPVDDIVSIGVGGGVVWAVTYDAVAHYDGHVWERFAVSSGHSPPILLVDAAGGMWRSAPNGAFRLDGASTYELDLPGAGDAGLLHMALTPDGTWWLAGYEYVYEWVPA